MNQFLEAFDQADVLVGHNIEFDLRMVVGELMRLQSPAVTNFLNYSFKTQCTMKQMTPVCKLKMQIRYTRKTDGEEVCFWKQKSPKLSEAYKHYFGYVPPESSLHNSLTDTILCLRVYLKLHGHVDLCEENPVLAGHLRMLEEGLGLSSSSVSDECFSVTSVSSSSTSSSPLRRSKRLQNQRLNQTEWTY
jgi:DNA polymerase III epsilon subunit-like protein